MNTKNKKEILGIDLGRTIVIGPDGPHEKTAFPDAVRVIRRLILERFGKDVHIVSKVDDGQKARAIAWLAGSGFYDQTGLLPEHVHFCAERHEKAPICEKIGITYFIDDRPEVMSHMTTVPHRFLFQADEKDVELFRDKIVEVTHVNSWIEIERLLL